MTRQEAIVLAERKAFEISFILFRLGERIRQKLLSERLQSLGISLLEQVSVNPSPEISKTTKAIEQLLKLGAEVDLINRQSVEVIMGELNKINSAIAELKEVESIAELKQSEIGNFHKPATPKTKPEHTIQSGQSGIDRQNDIAEKIRQMGTCRMKDVQEAFPDISERTLRYDLVKLTEGGILERLGNGGPNTFYRIRQARAIQVVDNKPNDVTFGS